MTIGGSNCFLMIYPYQLNVHHSAFCWLESLGADFNGWHLSCLGATNSWSCLFVFIAFLLLGRCKEVLPNRACQDTVFCVNGQYGVVSFLRNTLLVQNVLLCDGILFATSWAHLNIKKVFPGMGISIIKIRWSWNHLILIMGIPALVRHDLYIEMWAIGIFILNETLLYIRKSLFPLTGSSLLIKHTDSKEEMIGPMEKWLDVLKK